MLTNDLFDLPKRRHVGELNIVPILDMLVTIIFFLLLSTSFLQFNKSTVPPARTSVITSPEVPPPLQAHFVLAQTAPNKLRLLLHWAGATPGAYSENFALNQENLELDKLIAEKATEFTTQFKASYPEEKTIQVGLGRGIAYGKLILLMDVLRDDLPDIVLLSYSDAQNEAEKFAGAKNE